MNSVKVTTDRGSSWITDFNGNEQEARRYFMHQRFDMGPPDGPERMEQVIKAEFTQRGVDVQF